MCYVFLPTFAAVTPLFLLVLLLFAFLAFFVLLSVLVEGIVDDQLTSFFIFR